MAIVADEYVSVFSIDDSQYKAKIADLTTQQAPLLAQIKNIDAAIRSEAKTLADAQAQITLLGTGHKSLNDALAQSQTRLAGYLQQQVEVKNQLGQVGTALKAAQNQVDPLAKAYSDLGLRSSASLKQAATDAQAAFNTIKASGTASAADLVKAQAAVEAALAKTKTAVPSVADAFKTLGVQSSAALKQSADDAKKAYETIRASGTATSQDIVRAHKAMQDAVQKSGTDWKALGGSIQSAGQQITLATAPLLALGVAAIAASSDVNTGFREIRVRTGETGAALDGLKTSFEKVFVNVPASAESVGAALGALHSRTGQVGEGLEKLATQVLELSNITHTDLNANVAAITRAFGDWSIETVDQAAAMDEMFRATQQTGIGVTKLTELVVQFGSPLRALGFNFDQALAIMGKFEKEGVNIQTTLPGLRRELGNFAKAGIDAKTGFQAVIDSMKNARTEAEGLTIAVRIFGTRAAVDMFRAVKEGRFDIDGLTNSIKTGKDTILDATRDTRTFGESWTQVQHEIELALKPLGAELQKAMKDNKPLIEGAVGILAGLVKQFSELDPATKQAIIGIGAATAIIGPLTFALGTLTSAMGVLAGPLGIGLAVAALAGLVFAGDGAANSLGSAWAKMSGDTKDASVEMVAHIKEVTDALRVGLAAYIGFRVAGVPGAIVGGTIGVATLPKNEDSPMAQGFAQPGTATAVNWAEENRRAQEEFKRNMAVANGAVFADWKNTLGRWKESGKQAGQVAGGETAAGAAEGIKDGKPKIDAATQHAIDGIGKHGRKGGHDIAREMADGFKEGLSGFEAAFSVIQNASIAQVAGLTELLGKKARAGLEELSRAFKDVVPSVNSFLSAQGIVGKVTAEQLEAMRLAGDTQLLAYTEDWMKAQEAVNRAGIEMAGRLPVSLKAINDFLKDQGFDIQLTQEAWLKMSDASKTATVALGNLVAGQKDLKNEEVAGADSIENLTVKLLAQKMVVNQAFAELQKGNITFKEYIGWINDTNKAEKIAIESTDNLGSAIRTMGERFDQALLKTGIPAIKEFIDANNRIESTFSLYEQYWAILGKTGQELQNLVERDVRTQLSKIPDITTEQLNKAIEAHRKAAIQLPGIWNDVFAKMSSGAKSWAASIFGVLDTIPGKFGSTVKKVTDTIQQWTAFFNQILGLISKFSNSIPSSIGDAIGKIVGIFKGTASAVTASLADWTAGLNQTTGKTINSTNIMGQATGKMSDGMKTAFGVGASAMAGFATSMAVASSAGSKAMGFLEATVTSALAGIVAAFAFNPIAGAIVGGVSLLGGIIGLFKGKSAAEKEKESVQLQQMKADLQKTAQDVVNAAIDGFNKAIDFFQKLDDFTAPRARIFNKFFASMKLLMDNFVALAKEWGKDSLDKAKAFADAVGPVVTAVASGADAFEKLIGLTSVPQRAVDAFGGAMKAVIQSFSDIADTVGQDAIGAAKRLSKRIAQTIDVIASGVQAFAGLVTFTGLPQSQAKLFADGMRVAINEIGKVIDALENNALPNAKALSRRAAEVVDLIGNGVTALTSLSTFAGITQGTAAIFRDALTQAINAIIEVAGQIDSDLVAAAQRFSDRAGSSLTLIGTAIGSFKDLALIKTVPIDAFNALGAMIKQAVSILVTIASEISEEGASAASAFAAKAGPVVNTVKDAVAAFNTLDSLQNVEGGPFDALKLYIRRAVTDMGQLAGELSDDLVSKAAAFGGKIKGVFEAIGSAVSVFTGLSNLSGGRDVAGSQFPDIGRVLDFVLNGIRSGVDSLIKISGEVSGEGIAAALAFADKAKQMFEAVTTGAGAFTAIANMPPLSVTQWDDFFNRIVLMIQKLASTVSQAAQAHDLGAAFKSLATMMNDSLSVLISTIDSKILNSANDVAVKLSNVFDALKSGLEVFNLLRNYTSIPGVAFAGLISDMDKAFSGLDTLLSKAFDFNRLAVSFRDTVINAVGALRTGIQSIASAGGVIGQASGGSLGGSSSAAASYAGLSGNHLGSSSSSTSHASTVYQVNVTVNGSLIHQERITDAVVDALVKAQRMGRLKTVVV